MALNAIARRLLPAFQWLPLQLAILYFLADVFLNRLAFTVGWTIFWPLNGITIALLLLHSRKEWPSILIGVSVGTGIGEFLDGNAAGFEVLQRFISVLEVFLCAWILPRFDNFSVWLRRPFFLTRFLLALAIGPGLSGILAAVLFHLLQGEPYLRAFNNWATSDALGIALTLPRGPVSSLTGNSVTFRQPPTPHKLRHPDVRCHRRLADLLHQPVFSALPGAADPAPG